MFGKSTKCQVKWQIFCLHPVFEGQATHIPLSELVINQDKLATLQKLLSEQKGGRVAGFNIFFNFI